MCGVRRRVSFRPHRRNKKKWAFFLAPKRFFKRKKRGFTPGFAQSARLFGGYFFHARLKQEGEFPPCHGDSRRSRQTLGCVRLSARPPQALLEPGAGADLVARFECDLRVFGAGWPACTSDAPRACVGRVDRRVTGEQVCLRTIRWHAITSEGALRTARNREIARSGRVVGSREGCTSRTCK